MALAAVAGVATFFLLRRPAETGPLALAPIVIASTQTGEETPEPVVEDIPEPEVVEPEVVEPEVVEPEVAVAPTERREVDPPRMTSPMVSAPVRMTEEPRAPSMDVVATMQAPMTTSMPAMTSNTDMPETPSRQEVQSALLAVRRGVQECMGRGGRVPVRVTVSGRTGRVMTATVQDAYFARQPTGGCIARAVRQARFPRFSQERLVVVYPYEF